MIRNLSEVKIHGEDFEIAALENRPDFEGIKIKKILFALSEKQRNELVEIAENATSKDLRKRNEGYKHSLMIRTQIYAGLRVSELINLTVGDLNLGSEPTIRVQSRNSDDSAFAFKPKTVSSNRIIPIPKILAIELKGYLGKRSSGYVFKSRKTSKRGRYSKESVIGFVNKYAKMAKSIGFCIGTHALRRTFASLMIKDHSLIVVSKLLGHANTKTTLSYLYQIEDQSEFDAVRKTQKGWFDNKRDKKGH